MAGPSAALRGVPERLGTTLTRLRRATVSLRTSRAARRRAALRFAALCVAGLLCISVARTRSEAASERARWGSTMVALRAVATLEPGAALRPSDLEPVEVPRHLAPAGALESPPPDAVLAEELAAGELLAARHLSGTTGPGTPAGSLAVRLEPVVPPPRLEVGDTVEVVSAVGSGPNQEPLRREAVVLVAPSDTDPTVEVALSRSDAMAVTEAALTGGLAVLRRSG
ncbi:MAG: hypothetical protein R2716_02975 [Microthrixaceae bacterium]